MRLVSYKADGGLRAGLVTGERLVDLERAGVALGIELGVDLLDILAMEGRGTEVLGQVEAGARAGSVESTVLDDAVLGPAIPRPGKLLCLAGNYQSHLTEGGGQGVNKAEITPRFFIKPATAIIGTGDAITIPPVSETVDYEIEIAAVIGKRGRAISLADAGDYVGGYLVFNDISARHLKGIGHRTARPMDDFFDWLVGKWCDSFAVVGPYLVTSDEIPDPAGLEMALRVNGTLKQHSSAGEMIFAVPEAITWISGFVTLEPGDLICMGTPGGVGETTQTYLKPGDVVEGEIERLGTIVNSVV